MTTPTAIRETTAREAGRMAAAMALKGRIPLPDGATNLPEALAVTRVRVRTCPEGGPDGRVLLAWWAGYLAKLTAESNRRAALDGRWGRHGHLT